jgi:hypothetical protein
LISISFDFYLASEELRKFQEEGLWVHGVIFLLGHGEEKEGKERKEGEEGESGAF